MTCREVQEFFSDLYDGELPTDRKRVIESHVATCPVCHEENDVFVKSMQALTTTASIEAPERFVEAVTTSMRIERVAMPPELTMAPPKKASPWAPVAAAAGILVALATGYIVAITSQQQYISALKNENEKLRNVVVPPPKVELPDNVVLTGGQQIPIEKYVLQEIAKRGFIQLEGRWMTVDMKDRFEKNARDIEAQIAQITRLEGDKKDLGTALERERNREVTEKQAADKLGLQRYGAWYVSPEWREKLDAGKLLLPDGTWKDRDEILARIMQENRLVQHGGRWMTEEQRDGALAQQYVRKSLATPDSAVSWVLDDLEIGPPMSFKNLTLYPLMGVREDKAAIATLHESLGSGKVEIADTAGALAVRVRNDSPSDVFLIGGALLVGGRAPRVVARDTIVPAGKTVDVRAYDVDPAAGLHAGDKFQRESGHYLLTAAVRRGLAADAGQGFVWNAVGSRKGGTPAEAYKSAAAHISEYRTSLVDLRTTYPRAVGVAVAIGDRLEFVDVFATPALFQAYFERILLAAALEAATRSPEAKGTTLPNTMAAVKQFIESAFGADSEVIDETIVLRNAGGTAFGRAAVKSELALHVSLFAEPAGPEPRAGAEVNAAKLQRTVEDYEKRLETAASIRKPAIIREIASLPQKRATQSLLGLLASADANVRRAAIESLGRRGDASAVQPLIKLMRDAKQRDLGQFAATVDALARLGSEEAVNPMLEVLEGKEAHAAGIVADRIATLLLQQRRDEILERGVARMIDALERVTDKLKTFQQPLLEPESGYQGALAVALRATTGVNLVDAVEFRRWWNEPSNRKRFLEGRAKDPTPQDNK